MKTDSNSDKLSKLKYKIYKNALFTFVTVGSDAAEFDAAESDAAESGAAETAACHPLREQMIEI